MKRLRIFYYSLEDGFYNLKRGGMTGYVAIITIAFTMLNLGLFFLLWMNISPHFKGCLDEVKVVGYLKADVSNEAIGHLAKELKGLSEIKQVLFISQSEALARFKDSLGEDKYLLEGFEGNPLPASFELIIDEKAGINALDTAVANLSGREEFEEVQSGREWVRRLSIFLFLIKIIAWIVGGVLLFISLFIISNTVHLTFINRKEEVEIMRLVGANRWFIKIPFLIEGMINGFLGGVVSVGFLCLLFMVVRYQLNPYLVDVLGMIHIRFIPPSAMIFLMALGMGVGGLGSLISLRF